MQTFIILTDFAEHFGKRLKEFPDFKIVSLAKNKDKKRYFPDGEIYVKIKNSNKLKGKRVIILHSGAPKPNEGLVELEIILQILSKVRAKVEIFFTYFPYGMQDEIFEEGETNVAKNVIEKLLEFYKAKKIYIIDPHFGGREWVRKYPIENISAVPLLIEKAKKDFGDDILFLSPDTGGARRTRIPGIKKERVNSYRVKIISSPLSLKGRIIGIVDDLIETGGTLIRTYKECKKLRAKKVIALVTHGVLQSGVSRVKRKYNKLYLTNTIKTKDSNIDITNLILESILKYD